MIEFYAPEIEVNPVLPEGESAHCTRVLRMREGDEIRVVDGRGGIYRCSIRKAHHKKTEVTIIGREREQLHWTPEITLALAPTKNTDRMEWLMEKCVEIGVNRIVFLECERSVRKTMRRERTERILVSAMKQSLKATLPIVAENVPFEMFMATCSSAHNLKYVGYCSPEVERRDFANSYDGQSPVMIMIGPEGDFSPSEIALAIATGFKPVTFGNTRLRTETAALFGLCAAHTLITQHN